MNGEIRAANMYELPAYTQIGQSSARSKDLAATAIDLPLKDTYHLRQWPSPSNPWGRRFLITVSCAKSAVGAWV